PGSGAGDRAEPDAGGTDPGRGQGGADSPVPGFELGRATGAAALSCHEDLGRCVRAHDASRPAVARCRVGTGPDRLRPGHIRWTAAGAAARRAVGRPRFRACLLPAVARRGRRRTPGAVALARPRGDRGGRDADRSAYRGVAEGPVAAGRQPAGAGTADPGVAGRTGATRAVAALA